MEFPRKRESGDDRKAASTQTCPGENQDICGLCGKRRLAESDPIPVGGNLPDNVCQCFFFWEDDAPEANNAAEEAEPPAIQASDSQTVNLPVIEASVVEESSVIPRKDNGSSSEELNIPEFSLGSNNFDKLSPDQNSADHRSIKSPKSGEYSTISPITESGNISSGYALSLTEQSSDQINFTSPSSGEDSKKSSNKETSPSSGYAMSVGEQSFGRNFIDRRNITTSQNSGEDSENSSDIEKGRKYAQDVNKIIADSKISSDIEKGTKYAQDVNKIIADSKKSTDIEKGTKYAQDVNKIIADSQGKDKTEYRISQSSPSEQEQRNIKQLRAGKSNKPKFMGKYASNADSKPKFMGKYASNADSKHKIKSEYRSSQSSPTEQGHRNIKQQRSNEFNSESMGNYANKESRQHSRDIYAGGPTLPRPFPQHPQPQQPYINPEMNMPTPTPCLVHYTQQCPQPFYSYDNSATNMPIIQTNVPVRSSVAQHPQASTSFQSPNSEETVGLSKKSLAQASKMDSEENNTNWKNNWITYWANDVPPACAPPEEELSTQQSPVAADNENEGTSPGGPGFPETSPDERSSTEISEEEYRRQRSLRQHPRNNKKDRPK